MKFKFKRFDNPPDDTTENEVRICGLQFEDLTSQKASVNRLEPWKGWVVRVSTPQGGVIYRLLRGHGQLSIPAGICWMGPRTRSQLDVHENSEVEINRVNQFFGRLRYYNSHLDDTVRFSFRIGVWGLLVGILSIALSLLSIFKC